VLRKLMNWLHEDRGFTLIELMIVILVILVLAAILLPQFGLARERARKASCVSNQRNLETAVAMWQTDNPSTILVGGTLDGSTPSAATLAGNPQYTTSAMYVEPDDTATTTGVDYYISMGASAAPAVQTNPSYGHIACAADKTPDPWVAGYDSTKGSIPGINHTRGAQASP
jgi:prepilin-type N-terminal cleavage/methylation domain-containing protein